MGGGAGFGGFGGHSLWHEHLQQPFLQFTHGQSSWGGQSQLFVARLAILVDFLQFVVEHVHSHGQPFSS